MSVLLDAEKEGFCDYLEKLLPLVRKGGLIIAHDSSGQADQLEDYFTAITENPNLETVMVLLFTLGSVHYAKDEIGGVAMRRGLLVLAVPVLFCNEAPAELPREFDRSDRLFSLGLLDVTQIPYSADPAGQVDSTEAIQRAVNDARDNGLVCFFPEGTYLISDTISCEQEVAKLAQPRHVDGGTQHYWPVHRPIIILGSTEGKRPVLELSNDANGFDDPK